MEASVSRLINPKERWEGQFGSCGCLLRAVVRRNHHHHQREHPAAEDEEAKDRNDDVSSFHALSWGSFFFSFSFSLSMLSFFLTTFSMSEIACQGTRPHHALAGAAWDFLFVLLFYAMTLFFQLFSSGLPPLPSLFIFVFKSALTIEARQVPVGRCPCGLLGVTSTLVIGTVPGYCHFSFFFYRHSKINSQGCSTAGAWWDLSVVCITFYPHASLHFSPF